MNSPVLPPRAPTIILVGGEMTVDGGEVFDSRQHFEDDPRSYSLHQSLTSSLLWWSTVVSVVTPVLDSRSPGAFALVIGRQLLKEISSDGALRQRKLPAFLPGGAVKIPGEVVSGAIHLPNGYTERGPVGPDPDKPGRQWGLLSYDFGPPSGVAEAVGADVVVDVGLFPYVRSHREKEAFTVFEQARLARKDGVLVLPHTEGIQFFLDSYLEWVHKGRRDDGPYRLAPEEDLENFLERRHTIPIPIEATFKVTGFLQGDSWQDPDDFEAARALLQARYDLKIGIWDLVSNPTLRQTLLDSTPIAPAPSEAASLPASARARAKTKVAAFSEGVQHRKESKDSIVERLNPHGWLQDHGIIYPLVNFEGRVDSGVLLYLTLSITTHKCSVTIAATTSFYARIEPYLRECSDTLQYIAAPDECTVREGKTTLWRCQGGWGDNVNWDERISALVERTRRWVEVFADLSQECRSAQEARESARIAQLIELGLPEEQWRVGGALRE